MTQLYDVKTEIEEEIKLVKESVSVSVKGQNYGVAFACQARLGAFEKALEIVRKHIKIEDANGL